MEAIKETVNNVIKNLQKRQKKVPGKNSPEQALKKILSKKEQAHAEFNYFRKGALGVKVDSSTWLYYLNLQKGILLDKLRRSLKDIKEIHFSIGDVLRQDEKEKAKRRNL